MEDRLIHLDETEIAEPLGCAILLYMKTTHFERYNDMTSVSNGNSSKLPLNFLERTFSRGNLLLKRMSKLVDLKEKGVVFISRKMLAQLSKDEKTKKKAAGLLVSPHLAKVLIDVDRNAFREFLTSAGYHSENLGVDSRSFRTEIDRRTLAEAVYKQWFGDDQIVESPYRREIDLRGSATDEPHPLVSRLESHPTVESRPTVEHPIVAQPHNEGGPQQGVYSPTNDAEGNTNLFNKENEQSPNEPNEMVRPPAEQTMAQQPANNDTSNGYQPTNDAEGNQDLMNKTDMRQSSNEPNQMINKTEAEGLRSEGPNSCHDSQGNLNCPVPSSGSMHVNTATTTKSREDGNNIDAVARASSAQQPASAPAPASKQRPASAPYSQKENDIDAARHRAVHHTVSLPADSERPAQLQDIPPPATAIPPNIVDDEEKKPTQAVDAGKPQELKSQYCQNSNCRSPNEVRSPNTYYNDENVEKIYFTDLIEDEDVKQELIMYLEPKHSCIKNWRNLASKLGVKEQKRKYLETLNGPATLHLFEWIKVTKPHYTIQEFRGHMKYYERLDVVNYLNEIL